jgi:tRNA1Val (adenine37-N6)-methyltransferase
MVAMANQYFQFKQFTVWQQYCAMKVTTDACLFGAWAAEMIVDGGQMTDDSQKHPLVTTINNVTQSQTLAIESRPTANGQRTTVNDNPSTANDQRPPSPVHPSTVNRQLSTILDIGTGTGLLSLMLAQKSTHSIDAVEIDPMAAKQAMQNIQASPWNDRITVIKGDITQLELAHRYHTIISNPPFFENQLASPDAGRQKALHASELSLSNLFTAITRWLHPEGTLLLLLPAYRLAELEKLAVQHRMQLQAITWVKQTQRHEPFRMMVQLGYTPSGLQQNTITIREADQQYSEAFTALLKDYYLHL